MHETITCLSSIIYCYIPA